MNLMQELTEAWAALKQSQKKIMEEQISHSLIFFHRKFIWLFRLNEKNKKLKSNADNEKLKLKIFFLLLMKYWLRFRISGFAYLTKPDRIFTLG